MLPPKGSFGIRDLFLKKVDEHPEDYPALAREYLLTLSAMRTPETTMNALSIQLMERWILALARKRSAP